MSIKTSMLDYCKFILEKFIFNRGLFRKEYRKSLQYLAPQEKSEFRKWARKDLVTV